MLTHHAKGKNSIIAKPLGAIQLLKFSSPHKLQKAGGFLITVECKAGICRPLRWRPLHRQRLLYASRAQCHSGNHGPDLLCIEYCRAGLMEERTASYGPFAYPSGYGCSGVATTTMNCVVEV